MWGPTGCGKSCGVRDLLAHLGYVVMSLDGTDPDNGHELITWIKRTRGLLENAHGGQSAVFLDDVESFTEPTRTLLGEYLQKARDDTSAGVLVVTCTQLRDPALRCLASLDDDVRLFAPYADRVREWFLAHHPWEKALPDGTTERRVGFPAHFVQRHAHLLGGGDLRAIGAALESQVRFAGSASSRDDTFRNAFDATRRLLQRQVHWSRWAEYAEPRDVELVREHLPRCVPNDATGLDALADALDALSQADACQPANFEARAPHAAYPKAVVAATAHLTSRARDVGALAPPRSLRPTSGLPPQTERGVRPPTASEWWDVPTALEGPSLEEASAPPRGSSSSGRGAGRPGSTRGGCSGTSRTRRSRD